MASRRCVRACAFARVIDLTEAGSSDEESSTRRDVSIARIHRVSVDLNENGEACASSPSSIKTQGSFTRCSAFSPHGRARAKRRRAGGREEGSLRIRGPKAHLSANAVAPSCSRLLPSARRLSEEERRGLKAAKPPQPSLSIPKEVGAKEYLCLTEAYKARTLEDLSLHAPNKVAELLRFFRPFASANAARATHTSASSAVSADTPAPHPCVCVVEGPTGCGKKTLVLTTARALGLRPLEFAEEEIAVAAADATRERLRGRADEVSFGAASGLGEAFLSFLKLVLSRRALPLSEPSDCWSSSPAPLAVSRGFAFVDHLPVSLLARSPRLTEKLHALLRRFILDEGDLPCMRPLVLCVGVEWSEQRILRRLLPAQLMYHGRVKHLRLAAPTDAKVEKLLRLVRDCEVAALLRRGAVALSSRLRKADLRTIASAAEGDVRHALTSLHWAMFHEEEKPNSTRSLQDRRVVSAKDATWQTFHLIGKFLYAKRLVCVDAAENETAIEKKDETLGIENALPPFPFCRRTVKVDVRPVASNPAAATALMLDEEVLNDLLDAVEGHAGGAERERPGECRRGGSFGMEVASLELKEGRPVCVSQSQSIKDEEMRALLLASASVVSASVSSAEQRKSECLAFAPTDTDVDPDGWLWAKRHLNFTPHGKPLLGIPRCLLHNHEVSPKQLSPAVLQCRATRPSLYFSPDAVISEGAPDPELFTELLFSNYLCFFADIDDVSRAASAFSSASSVYRPRCRDWPAGGEIFAAGEKISGGERHFAAHLAGAPRSLEAVVCGRAVLDANLHPRKPSAERNCTLQQSHIGFSFSGNTVAEVENLQKQRTLCWRTYTRDTRVRMAETLATVNFSSGNNELTRHSSGALAFGASIQIGLLSASASTLAFCVPLVESLAGNAAACCRCLFSNEFVDFLREWRMLTDFRRQRRREPTLRNLPSSAPGSNILLTLPRGQLPCQRCLQMATPCEGTNGTGALHLEDKEEWVDAIDDGE